jgi:hypothetical protein
MKQLLDTRVELTNKVVFECDAGCFAAFQQLFMVV